MKRIKDDPWNFAAAVLVAILLGLAFYGILWLIVDNVSPMRILHVVMMVSGVGVLAYCLYPRKRVKREPELSSRQIVQALARKRKRLVDPCDGCNSAPVDCRGVGECEKLRRGSR